MNKQLIKKSIALISVCILAFIIISTVSILAYYLYASEDIPVGHRNESFNNFSGNYAQNQQDEDDEPSEIDENYEPTIINVLILGIDDEANLPDTIVLASYHSLFGFEFISIPRDTHIVLTEAERALMPGWFPPSGNLRLNTIFTYGGAFRGNGMELMQTRIENMFNIEIDFYVTMRFSGFRAIVDTVGGIYIDVPRAMHSGPPFETINIPAGRQRMNGSMALDFVRFRNLAQGDIARIDNQQIFMREFLAQAMTPESILGNARSYVITFDRHVNTNANLHTALSTNNINIIESFDMENARFHTLPGQNATIGGMALYALDMEYVGSFFENIWSEE